MTTSTVPNRRARLRAQTLAEIQEHALAQVAGAGPEALSLNAIARAMGMSGPALYRYFSSRDELLTVLAADAWGDLADELERAAAASRRRAPEGRFRAILDAYRDWALGQPHRYRLAMATKYGSGEHAPAETVPASHRGMLVILDAVAELGAVSDTRRGSSRALDQQLERWAGSRSGDVARPPSVLRLAVATWTRLHGLISLEIEGVFTAMGVDPALLYRAETDDLVAQHAALAPPPAG